jgi:glycine cleavage system H lipoate-binding protein
MAVVKNFLGADYELPQDRLYSSTHFWLRRDEGADGSLVLEVGVSGPGVALTGGLVELDVLAIPGADLVVDEEVAFATTRKAIKYFLSPLAGLVTHANTEATAEAVNQDPYGTWLFRMVPAAGWDARVVDALTYAAKLAASEHATDAAASAAKAGKGSPTCKSIYGGIKEG